MLLGVEGSEYLDLKSFIERYWNDLDKMSGNKLDIFYAVKELEETGYSIKKYFNLDNIYINQIPCIAIWEQIIREARYISIKDLESKELFEVFSDIVTAIEEGKKIDEICKIGDEKVKNLKDSKKNIVNSYIDNSTNYVHQSISDNTNGTIIGVNKGNIENTFCVDNDATKICQFIDDLKSKLSEICEMNEIQKKFFEKILDDLREPNLKNNEVQKNNLKMKFESFIMGLPQTVLNMLNVSGSLASIASFLGFNISNLF